MALIVFRVSVRPSVGLPVRHFSPKLSKFAAIRTPVVASYLLIVYPALFSVDVHLFFLGIERTYRNEPFPYVTVCICCSVELTFEADNRMPTAQSSGQDAQSVTGQLATETLEEDQNYGARESDNID